MTTATAAAGMPRLSVLAAHYQHVRQFSDFRGTMRLHVPGTITRPIAPPACDNCGLARLPRGLGLWNLAGARRPRRRYYWIPAERQCIRVCTECMERLTAAGVMLWSRYTLEPDYNPGRRRRFHR